MPMIVKQAKGFDYNRVEKPVRAYLRKQATTGHSILKRTAQGVWEMGQLLAEVKERLPHGEFIDWIEEELGITRQSVHNFITVYQQFPDLPKMSNGFAAVAAPTVLYALAAPTLDPEIRDAAFTALANGGIKTVADTKAFIAVQRAPVAAPEDEETDDWEDQAEKDEWGSEDEDAYDEIAHQLDAPTNGHGNGHANGHLPVAPPIEISDDLPLPEKVKAARVVHDTLPKPAVNGYPNGNHSAASKDDDEMTAAEWLQTIPAYRVLSKLKGGGIIAKRSMLDYRALEKALKTFAHNAARCCETVKHPDGTPFSGVVFAASKLRHPREWGVCSPCRGNGCERCGSAGYDMGGGISGERIEKGDVAL